MKNNNREKFNLYTQVQRLAVRGLLIVGIFLGSVPTVLAKWSLTHTFIGGLVLSAGFQGASSLSLLNICECEEDLQLNCDIESDKLSSYKSRNGLRYDPEDWNTDDWKDFFNFHFGSSSYYPYIDWTKDWMFSLNQTVLSFDFGVVDKYKQKDVLTDIFNYLGCAPANIKGLKIKNGNFEDLMTKNFTKTLLPESLQDLQLPNNTITALPPLNTLLESPGTLIFFNISHNDLSSLDKDFFKDMAGLETVDMAYNELECLPSSLGNLTELDLLLMESNPLKNCSVETLIDLKKNARSVTIGGLSEEIKE